MPPAPLERKRLAQRKRPQAVQRHRTTRATGSFQPSTCETRHRRRREAVAPQCWPPVNPSLVDTPQGRRAQWRWIRSRSVSPPGGRGRPAVLAPTRVNSAAGGRPTCAVSPSRPSCTAWCASGLHPNPEPLGHPFRTTFFSSRPSRRRLAPHSGSELSRDRRDSGGRHPPVGRAIFWKWPSLAAWLASVIPEPVQLRRLGVMATTRRSSASTTRCG